MGKAKNRVGEIGYNLQGEKMIIIRHSKLKGQKEKTIDIRFEDGSITYNKLYSNFKKCKIKHPIRYEESFAYHIEVELGLNLDDIWNWDKNNELGINPYEIAKQSHKKIWLYCLKHDYHNYDRKGNKVGYQLSCSNFYNNKSRCSYCGKNKTHYKDSLAYKCPQVAKMIAIEENDLTFEDCYNISCFSKRKFYFKCFDCGMISDKRIRLSDIVIRGYSCKYCSDGISIPEKFIVNILKQLKIEFKTQLNKSDFKWCGYFRYDFYLPKYNIIIEANGMQHYKECTLTKRTLEQEQWNDLFKYKCAKSHVNNYIVIDCRYSELKWLKENIIKELSDYFDLSSIDWELAWEESQNSLCVKVWELYEEGYNRIYIIDKLSISDSAYYSYIKKYKSQF